MDLTPVSEEIKRALVRSVSKLGDFFLAQSEPSSVAGKLSDGQVVALYEHIRDNSMRLEVEWREEFVRAFSKKEHVLPAMQVSIRRSSSQVGRISGA